MAATLTKNKKKPKRTTEGVEALILPVSEVKDRLLMLVYGMGGQGKTTFGASSGLKTLIIDFNEKGSISVKRQPNVYVYKVQYWTELNDIYWYLKNGNHDFQVVVLDTVSSMALIGMKWVLGDDASRDANRDPLMPDKRSWGKLGEVLKTSFINWCNLDMHVIFTAHERTTVFDDEDEGTSITITHPALSPAPRDALISWVHVVGRIYKRKVSKKIKGKSKKVTEFRMLVGDNEKYVTKLRQDPTSEVLVPDIVRNPTLKYFMDTILPTLEQEA